MTNPPKAQSRVLCAAGVALALILSACGGGVETTTSAGAAPEAVVAGETISAGDSSAAEQALAAAEANLSTLNSSGATVFDIEVLSVADGGITTLNDVVDGDKPVLLWFWSPH